MTALLVIATFTLFILVDYAFGLSEAPSPAIRRARREGSRPVAPFSFEPSWVGGFLLPEGYYYHRGHTWARPVGDDHVVIGIDDFAGKLLGEVESVRLPRPGQWMRQGKPGLRTELDGRIADLLAPVDGEVVEVNPELAERPRLLTDDPYGRGWLVKVRTAELDADLHNLMEGRLAHRWIEDAGEQLELELMALSGSVLRDGGRLVADFARHLSDDDWRRLVGDFLLT